MKLKRNDYYCIFVSIILISLISYYVCSRIKNGSEDQIEPFTAEGGENFIEINNQIFDKFYANIYDKIFTDSKRTSLELATIIELTVKNVENPFPEDEINFLDAGCGTGINAAVIGKMYPITCFDKSNDMLAVAKTRQSDKMKLLQGDIKDRSSFEKNTFSHIIALYFTMYYFENINNIFENFSKWVKPNGFVVIHLVDKKAFDPIVNPSSPYVLMDVQSHLKKRKTDSLVVFNDFKYTSDFKLDNKTAAFEEVFEFKDGKTRKQRHKFYMYSKKEYVAAAERFGFVLINIESQILSGYSNHYIFTFRKQKEEKYISRLKAPVAKSVGTSGPKST